MADVKITGYLIWVHSGATEIYKSIDGSAKSTLSGDWVYFLYGSLKGVGCPQWVNQMLELKDSLRALE